MWHGICSCDCSFQCNGHCLSAGLCKNCRHGLTCEPCDVARKVECTSSVTDEISFELLVINVKCTWGKESSAFERTAQTQTRDDWIDSNLREHHTHVAVENIAFFKNNCSLLNLNRATHNLSRDTYGVQFTNYRTWRHTGVHLLNNNLVRCNIAFFCGTACFGLLEFSEQFKRVEVCRRDQCWLDCTLEQFVQIRVVVSCTFPSDAHQSLLCDLDVHVGTK